MHLWVEIDIMIVQRIHAQALMHFLPKSRQGMLADVAACHRDLTWPGKSSYSIKTLLGRRLLLLLVEACLPRAEITGTSCTQPLLISSRTRRKG